MSTGPVHVSESVLRAQLGGYTSSHSASFWTTHSETTKLLSRMFQTENPVLAVHGSIRTGIDICCRNAVPHVAKTLVLSNGFWGEYLARNAAEYSSNVVTVESSSFSPFPAERLKTALKQHPDCGLVIVAHVETNTGVVNDIQALSTITRKAGALFFVDAASSLGCMPYQTDSWGIDIGVTGSHKTLGSVPGLTLISLSERARGLLEASPAKDLPDLVNLAWLFENCLRPGKAPSYTHSTPLIQALHAALTERLTPSLEHWQSVSASCATEFRRLIRDAELNLVTDGSIQQIDERQHLCSTVMAVRLPDGIQESRVRERMEAVHGIFVIGNVGELAGRSVRVGLMSPVQMDRKCYGATVVALVETLNHCRQTLKDVA